MSIKVLIVDDDTLLRAGLKMMIDTQSDLAVVGQAGDGATAIAMAKELEPDVVLMDIRMPGVDGLEATHRITASEAHRKDTKEIRILILTTFEIDYNKCLFCELCVDPCPVDCIHIETGKRDKEAPAIFAASGNPIKLDVTVFDIDMSLCCYCNLCTYPCPTECIYMTTEYEFATTDLTQHLYRFAKKDAKFITENPKPKPAPAPAPAKPAEAAAPPPPEPSEA